MNISKVNNFSFGSKYRDPNFYSLPVDEKLNQIYDKLADVQMYQEHNAETITNNQYTQQRSNELAFNILSTPSANLQSSKNELVSDVFERNRVLTLPVSGVN